VLTRKPLLEQVYCSEVFEPAGQPTFHLPAILDNLTPLARVCSCFDGAAVAPMAAMRTRRLVNCILVEIDLSMRRRSWIEMLELIGLVDVLVVLVVLCF
jgi:hypothetical protein